MTTLFTIGHSRHPADRFVALLRAREVARIVDVRSHPVSRWAPQFGKAALTKLLEANGIDYVFLGGALGGRPRDAVYRPDGMLDYARRAEAPEFQDGVGRLLGLARDASSAVMCAEEDPARCHRRLLIAPAVLHAAVDVVHLRGDGTLERESPSRP